MVNFEVIFSPESLINRGIPHTKQASVYCHELFGSPKQILGYQGHYETARKIKEKLKKRFATEGRLKQLSDEELESYGYFVPYLL